MTKFLAALLLSFTLTIVTAQTKQSENLTVTVKEFTAFIDSIGLKFTMPDNYKETPVIENGDLWYAFAIKSTREDFEVRYTVWSLKPTMQEFEDCKRDPNCKMAYPNNIHKGRAEANVLNMTAGRGAQIGGFPPEAVKKEFNADVGGSAFFEFNCAFGKGYKYGHMVILHKNNVADVIITYLSNDKSKHSDLMLESFHALTFK